MKLIAQSLLVLATVCSLQTSAQNDTTATKRIAKTTIGLGIHAFPNSKVITLNPHIRGEYSYTSLTIPQIYFKRNFCVRSRKALALQMNLDHRKGHAYASANAKGGGSGFEEDFEYWNIQFSILRERYFGDKQEFYRAAGLMYNLHFLEKGTLSRYTYNLNESENDVQTKDVYNHYFAPGNLGFQLALGARLPMYKHLFLHVEGSVQLRTPLRGGTGPDATVNFLTGLSF